MPIMILGETIMQTMRMTTMTMRMKRTMAMAMRTMRTLWMTMTREILFKIQCDETVQCTVHFSKEPGSGKSTGIPWDTYNILHCIIHTTICLMKGGGSNRIILPMAVI